MFAEVRQIAKSTAKWTWHHFDIAASDRRFSEKQSNRVKNRWGDNEDKLASARLMAAKGMSQRAIAAELGIAHTTIGRWLKD
jgi:DNA invertase Pin-like site-specific DNA recombinase